MLRTARDAQDPGDPSLGPLLSLKILPFTGICWGQEWVQPLLPTYTPGGETSPRTEEEERVHGPSLITRMRAMGLSNIQVFAPSLPGTFVIIPNRVGPTHLWRKGRHVAA